MFPEHERCHKPQRWDTGFGTGEEEQEITGWQRGESLFSLGRPGAGFVARAEDSQSRVCSSSRRTVLLGGFARSPGRQEDWKAKGGCEEDSRKREGKD